MTEGARTSIPFELLTIGVVFFAGMGIANSIKAHRRKEKEYYYSGLICFLVVVQFFLLISGQIHAMFALWAFVIFVSAWRLPRIQKIVDKELREMDISGPIKAGDFLRYDGWVKLAHSRGVRGAVFAYFLFAVTFIGGTLYLIHIVYDYMPLWYIITFTITFSALTTVMFRQQLKRLKQ